jgi:acyl-CoA synthetase (AMP-forming)/AMP-acid ligase II
LEGSGAGTVTGFPEISPDDVAFIQYTSGSTGVPKGVMLSHRGLLINLGQLIEGMQITPQDRFVSWLPVYHDMGLILKTMAPFYLAAERFLLPTNLANVRVWLDAIQQCRATLTAAPDFAYRLCLRYVRNPESYDLSSLRVALNAAEPVRPKTIHDFERIFGLQNVVIPGYGLAEATVGVSTWTPSTPVRVDERGIVSVGRPFRDIGIEIVENEVTIPANQICEIMIQSPANTAGYYDSREDTERLFWKDGFIRTGDLGYLDSDGYLYVTGRAKNIIKHGGETIFPQEVEGIVECLPFVRRSAAVGIDKGGVEGEQLYVFAELKKSKPPAEDELYENSLEVVQAIQQQFGTRPGRVYLVKPRAIPKAMPVPPAGARCGIRRCSGASQAIAACRHNTDSARSGEAGSTKLRQTAASAGVSPQGWRRRSWPPGPSSDCCQADCRPG